MKDVITQFIKSIGVSVFLTSKVFHDLLDVYYYNWIGKDGKFYSLLAPCNMTTIFVKPSFRIGAEMNDSLTDRLYANLRVSDTKEDWLIDRWTLSDAKQFNKKLRQFISEISIPETNNPVYAVCSYNVFVTPSIGVSISYSFNGKYAGTFCVWNNCKTIIQNQEQEFIDFLQELNVIEYIEIR